MRELVKFDELVELLAITSRPPTTRRIAPSPRTSPERGGSRRSACPGEPRRWIRLIASGRPVSCPVDRGYDCA